MRCLRRIVRILGAVLLLWPCLFQVQAAGAQTETEDAEISVVQEELLGQIELEEIQKLVDGILDEKSFSIKEAVMNMMKGEEPISKEAVQDMVRSFFFSGINQEKGMLFRILLLILLAAVLSNFADVFENGYAGNVSFYIVYLVLFMTLMENFANPREITLSQLRSSIMLSCIPVSIWKKNVEQRSHTWMLMKMVL